MRIVKIVAIVAVALLLELSTLGWSVGGGGQGELPPRIAPSGTKKVPPVVPGNRIDNESQIP